MRPASSLTFDERSDCWFFKTLSCFVRRQASPLAFSRKVNLDVNDHYTHQHQEQSTHRALHPPFPLFSSIITDPDSNATEHFSTGNADASGLQCTFGTGSLWTSRRAVVVDIRLGIVAVAFMIDDIRSRTGTVALRHRVVGDSVCRWLLYAPTFKPYPHRPRLYTWDREKRARCRWLSATFLTQRMRTVLDRTDDSKTVLSFLHTGRYSLTLAESSRDIWWYVIWQDVSITILRYGMFMFYSLDYRLTTVLRLTDLIPTYHFPTPLRQAVAALLNSKRPMPRWGGGRR